MEDMLQLKTAQLFELWLRLPEKVKKLQTNLQDRREVPFEYIEQMPQTPKTRQHEYVVKKYIKAFDQNSPRWRLNKS